MSESVFHRAAIVHQMGVSAGHLAESGDGGWAFTYLPGYSGPPISLTLPLRPEPYAFRSFPSVFEGLLPEGPQLEALLRTHKIDRSDVFQQLLTVGADLVGSLAVFDSNPTSW